MAALLSVRRRFNQAEDKQGRYKSHPLVCTTALVRGNTGKQSFAVFCYHSQPNRLKAELRPADNVQRKSLRCHHRLLLSSCLLSGTYQPWHVIRPLCTPQWSTGVSEAAPSVPHHSRNQPTCSCLQMRCHTLYTSPLPPWACTCKHSTQIHGRVCTHGQDSCEWFKFQPQVIVKHRKLSLAYGGHTEKAQKLRMTSLPSLPFVPRLYSWLSVIKKTLMHICWSFIADVSVSGNTATKAS